MHLKFVFVNSTFKNDFLFEHPATRCFWSDTSNNSSVCYLLNVVFDYKHYWTSIQSTSIVLCATREDQQSSIMFFESMFCVLYKALLLSVIAERKDTCSGS